MKDFKFSTLNDIYGTLLTKRQSDILRHYYDYDFSYAEIAEVFDITRQGVGQIIDTSSKQLQSYEEQLGLCDILTRLEKIKDESNEQNTIDRIDEIILSMRGSKD